MRNQVDCLIVDHILLWQLHYISMLDFKSIQSIQMEANLDEKEKKPAKKYGPGVVISKVSRLLNSTCRHTRANMADSNQVLLSNPPSDGIASVRFSPVSDRLVSASWDNGIRVHDVPSNALLAHLHHETAALDACFGDDDNRVYSVGLDRRVLVHDTVAQTSVQVGVHAKAARCVQWSSELGMIVSGSWDASVCCWDPRAPGAAVSTMQQPGKVFAMSLAGYKLVVCTAERHVTIFDIRNTAQVEQRRVSSLKHQTRAVRISPDQSSTFRIYCCYHLILQVVEFESLVFGRFCDELDRGSRGGRVL
jgi:WD40 repeat protein